jgi:hypothetical protein
MKTLLAILSLAAGLAQAGEVQTSIPKKEAVAVDRAFDRLDRKNVTVTVRQTENAADSFGRGGKTYTVDVGQNSGSAVVEFIVLKDNGVHEPRILPMGRGMCAGPAETFEFAVNPNWTTREIKGWFVRVVSMGQIVGVAASSPKFEAMAADPKTEVRYGER